MLSGLGQGISPTSCRNTDLYHRSAGPGSHRDIHPHHRCEPRCARRGPGRALPRRSAGTDNRYHQTEAWAFISCSGERKEEQGRGVIHRDLLTARRLIKSKLTRDTVLPYLDKKSRAGPVAGTSIIHNPGKSVVQGQGQARKPNHQDKGRLSKVQGWAWHPYNTAQARIKGKSLRQGGDPPDEASCCFLTSQLFPQGLRSPSGIPNQSWPSTQTNKILDVRKRLQWGNYRGRWLEAGCGM